MCLVHRLLGNPPIGLVFSVEINGVLVLFLEFLQVPFSLVAGLILEMSLQDRTVLRPAVLPCLLLAGKAPMRKKLHQSLSCTGELPGNEEAGALIVLRRATLVEVLTTKKLQLSRRYAGSTAVPAVCEMHSLNNRAAAVLKGRRDVSLVA